MTLEAVERRIRSIIDEVLAESSDESSSTEEFDHCSEHELESYTQAVCDDLEAISSEWEWDDEDVRIVLGK